MEKIAHRKAFVIHTTIKSPFEELKITIGRPNFSFMLFETVVF